MIRKMVRTLTQGLLLRSGVFYFRMDVKIADNKYKSIRRSLHTTNVYTAIKRLNYMKRLINTFNTLTPEEQTEFIKFYTGGEETMEKNYSIHQLKELKTCTDKIEYPEDILHLEYWKTVIPKLYLDRKDAPLCPEKRRPSKKIK